MKCLLKEIGENPLPTVQKHIPGLKKLAGLSNFCISSGLTAFDELLGGGIVAGSIVLLGEDNHRTYSRYFLDYFIAEGLVCLQNICLMTPLGGLQSVLETLPGLCEESESDSQPLGNLDIAWRYRNLLPQQVSGGNSFSHQFDLSKRLNLSELTAPKEIYSCQLAIDPEQSLQSNLSAVLSHISALPSTDSKKVSRIVLESLGSPLWGDQPQELGHCLGGFFSHLRLLTRDTMNVVLITVPASLLELFEEEEGRWVTHADYHLEIEGFDGCVGESLPNAAYAEFDGILRVLRLPHLRRLNLEPVSRPATLDWAFKVKRRRLLLQHLNLPPSISQTVSRSTAANPVFGCEGASFDF